MQDMSLNTELIVVLAFLVEAGPAANTAVATRRSKPSLRKILLDIVFSLRTARVHRLASAKDMGLLHVFIKLPSSFFDLPFSDSLRRILDELGHCETYLVHVTKLCVALAPSSQRCNWKVS